MEVTSHSQVCDITEGRAHNSLNQSESISTQPTANGTLPHRGTGAYDSSLCPAPICAPPPQSSTFNRRHHHHRLSSTKSSASSKADAAHIKEVAGDDCCVHCLLACLFCELLSMCLAVGECLACGMGGAGCCDAVVGCCCCVEAACTEEACQAALDCGIAEVCCSSSDCLEVCLECCSICFPS